MKKSLCLPQAVDKFKQALGIDPSRHDTLWCLGRAYTSQVRRPPSRETAFCPNCVEAICRNAHFRRAS